MKIALKNVLKQIGQISLALLLSCMLFNFVTYIYREVDNKIAASIPPSKTEEESIADFNANKEKFETIKNYVLKKGGISYLYFDDYEGAVNDEDVKSALDFVFTQLNYNKVMEYGEGEVFFYYDKNGYHTSGIAYSEGAKRNVFLLDSEIQKNWYTIDHSYYGDPLENIPHIFLRAIHFVLWVAVYLLLGKGMKKDFWRKVFRAGIALLLACIFIFIAQDVSYRIQYDMQSRYPVLKISREELISVFNANREKFKIAADYIQAEDTKFRVTEQDYSEKISDETVKSALDVIFHQLGCDAAGNTIGHVYFIYRGENRDTGLIYVKNPNERIYSRSESLGDDWHYDEDGGIRINYNEFHPAVCITAFVVLLVGLYFLINLIPPFRKYRKPKEAKAAASE